MNNVSLVGTLAQKPRLHYTQNGAPYCLFTVVCARKSEHAPDQLDCRIWGAPAEELARFGEGGMQVAISGALNVGRYDYEDAGERRVFVHCYSAELALVPFSGCELPFV